MRVGTSWKTGNGRREWISMGLGGWLLFGWLIALAVLAWWTVKLAVLLLVALARVSAPLFRSAVEACQRRWAARQA